MMYSPVPLTRYFSLIPQSETDSDNNELSFYLSAQNRTDWQTLHEEYRCVILAEAGAGKTYEMKSCAEHIQKSGRAAFFIRIEDIADGFEEAFEVGCAESFENWLSFQEEAWFFLDSVDEARLENPSAFRKAIRHFSLRIKSAQQRAHIFVSSRPYAWQARSDRGILEQYLPFETVLTDTLAAAETDSEGTKSSEAAEVSSALKIFALEPLDESGIRLYAKYRETPQIDTLLTDLHRANLIAMASRPFDLESILAKWKADQKLGGRLELLRHNIALRLTEIEPDRSQRQPLNPNKALSGAHLLAAAVIMTGEPGIRIPDAVLPGAGIDAEVILGDDWTPSEVRALLERGIFNDVIYGIVRFRHRDVRELLAAEWFSHQLDKGHSRRATESLFIREQYGQIVITPRLRPVLPWLILFDDALRQKVLEISPEIVFEGGDAARLPLSERQAILSDVVKRIAESRDYHSARDNDAIARIAQPDLMNDTLRLIETHRLNDDAIFFLGRLVWQGGMKECVPILADIAIDCARDIYARIAATRAVMTCGNENQITHLWDALIHAFDVFPRKLLAEVLDNASANAASVGHLLASIEKLDVYERFESSGLNQALHLFIARFPDDPVSLAALGTLVCGLNVYLERQPFIDGTECHVSKAFVWLLGPATHAVERLVSAHTEAALSLDALAIMLKVPSVRFWQSEDFEEYKTLLHDIVPAWKELNDALFWKSIEAARDIADNKACGRITDDFAVNWLGHFWKFGPERLGDVLDFIATRDFLDDKFVAISIALRLYNEAGKPESGLSELRRATDDNADLRAYLDGFLNPQKSQAMIESEEKDAQRKAKWAKEREARDVDRQKWISRLKAAPDNIRTPSGLKHGEFSNDQFHLFCEINERGNSSSGPNWAALIPEFGEDVAKAYRDAAKAHWRHYVPALKSEGGDTTTIPYELLFAKAGLDIEANEDESFPSYLTDAELQQALHYMIWELNGLPKWLEKLYLTFPAKVQDAFLKELFWELTHTLAEEPACYLLQKIAMHAPWSHQHLAPVLLEWMGKNEIINARLLRYCLLILQCPSVHPDTLTELVKSKISQGKVVEQMATWYALWVSVDAQEAIPAVEEWLSNLHPSEAVIEAQLFITKLMGSRFTDCLSYSNVERLSVNQLKSLYLLMLHYIQVQDDIERANMGVYSPGLRDDAQDGRNALFNRLSERQGKEAYVALAELSEEHPVITSRSWMKALAYKRAQEDANLEAWSAHQMRDYAKDQMSVPATHRQLYDLTVNRLIDLKSWIEGGNDSPYRTWQRVEGETEVRNLVAGWLNQNASGRYSCAQENELSNRQRPDIWTLHPLIPSPVPIELKLLDNWSGPDLCERLRNQLAGDYLREEAAGCGVMLLVWTGRSTQAHWQIDRHNVPVSGVADALKIYWNSIAGDFPGVAAIDVILIDLTVREIKSNI